MTHLWVMEYHYSLRLHLSRFQKQCFLPCEHEEHYSLVPEQWYLYSPNKRHNDEIVIDTIN